MEYKVIQESKIWRLESEVAQLMAEGWKPIGCLKTGFNLFVQSMIKESEKCTTN